MNRAAAIDAGLRVSLGSDVGAGPDRSMVRVARAAIDAAKQACAPAVPSAAEMFHQITEGNAAALGLPQTGCIGRGMAADLLLLRPTTEWTRSPDPLCTLLYTWDDRWLRTTFAAGRLVYSAPSDARVQPPAPGDHTMNP
jgi:cytosine/adenosine deaminase-related metal-dependent hydrolase